MDQNDKIIADYFDQLPEAKPSRELQERLVRLGEQTIAERAELRQSRSGIWIGIASTVGLCCIAMLIFRYFGVDLSAMWSAMKIESPTTVSMMTSELWAWFALGALATAMLIGYTLLTRRLHSDSRQ